MKNILKLAELFGRFPGIGPRQSKRFVFFLLHQEQSFLDELGKYIKQIKNTLQSCENCFRFFDADGHTQCDICGSPNRDNQLLMVVEKDTDLDAIERSNAYMGLYFVLGGTLSPIEKSNTVLRFDALTKRCTRTALKELIIATSANPEGEETAFEIERLLKPLAEQNQFVISRLGRGLSTGSELEYADSDTIRNALNSRK